MHARAANIYRTVDLESAPKSQILVRLFDRFSRDIGDAHAAITRGDIAAKAAAIGHASQIVVQLRAALDHKAAPELCAQLDALYGYVVDQLSVANAKLTTAPLDHATRVMVKLGDAFRRACERAR